MFWRNVRLLILQAFRLYVQFLSFQLSEASLFVEGEFTFIDHWFACQLYCFGELGG